MKISLTKKNLLISSNRVPNSTGSDLVDNTIYGRFVCSNICNWSIIVRLEIIKQNEKKWRKFSFTTLVHEFAHYCDWRFRHKKNFLKWKSTSTEDKEKFAQRFERLAGFLVFYNPLKDRKEGTND